MTYLLTAMALAFGLILCVLLVVQQFSLLEQAWANKPGFDPSRVLEAARMAWWAIVGASLVVAGLVFHWRFVHGRLDWDWSLILGHADVYIVDSEDHEDGLQDSPVDPWCLERCSAFCSESSDEEE